MKAEKGARHLSLAVEFDEMWSVVGAKVGRGGCGMPLIITPGEYLPMWWVLGKMRCS